jgi:formylglycine-generating enzyme required for sulfatase activity
MSPYSILSVLATGLVIPATSLLFGQATGKPEAREPARHALLIANSKYLHLPNLSSPTLEVTALTEPLRKSRFEPTLSENVQHEPLLKKIEPDFFAKLRPGDTVLFFYSGYAIQVSGANYLVPTDFDPNDRRDISLRAQSLEGFAQQLDSRNVGLKILVLEASRQAAALMSVPEAGMGLTYFDMADSNNILVAFSGNINQFVQDPPPGGLGLFTRTIVDTIPQPGLDLLQFFATVQNEVTKSSKDGQRPYFVNQGVDKFYFTPPVVKPPETIKEITVVRPAKNKKDRQEYVKILPGTFLMGCVPEDKRCDASEKPQHKITISKDFYLGVTETTVDAYARFADEKHRKMPPPPDWPGWDRKWAHGNHPINGVSWEEAKAFCEWVGGRLPTEAEWEDAARAGADNEIYPLNNENSRDKANFLGKKGNDKYDNTAPVGSFDPNRFGLYDMAGNVWEWCRDWFSPTYYKESPGVDPEGPSSGKDHIVRGGSWYSDAQKHLRISLRQHFAKGGDEVGFRCLLEDTPATQSLLVQ